MKSFIGLISILIILLVAQVSSATTQFTGVASQAVGGTGRAAVQAGEVGLLNPASFIFVSGYHIESSYREFQNAGGGTTRNALFHASENQTDSLFPLAVTYLKTKEYGLGLREDLHFTTGQFIFKKTSFGIDIAKYTFTPDGGVEDDEWDLKAGFMFVPMNNLGLGLVFTNLLVTDFSYLKRGVEAGVNYLFKDFLRMALDVSYQLEDNPNHDGVVMVGLEHTYVKQVPLRVGFKWDDPNNENYWTLGIGWNAPKIGFAYSYEKNVSKTDEYGHSFDLQIYF